jgi:succinate dehydrogenase flavin-adding protein (antitoxin of CptAB toxin-antitoxin module)
MNVREAMKQREHGCAFWESLTESERGELGDELVLGDLDLFRWFDGKRPSGAFLAEVDYRRILWESTL